MSTRKNDMMLAMHHHQQQQQQQQQQLGLCIDNSNDVKGNPYYLQQSSQPVATSPRARGEGGSMLTQNLLQNSLPSSTKSGSGSSKSARGGGKKEGASPRFNSSSQPPSSSQPAPQMIAPSMYQQPAALIANQSGQVRGRGESVDQNNVHKRLKTVEIKMESTSEKSLQHHPQQHQQLQHYPQVAQIAVGNIQADVQPSLKVEWNEG